MSECSRVKRDVRWTVRSKGSRKGENREIWQVSTCLCYLALLSGSSSLLYIPNSSAVAPEEVP